MTVNSIFKLAICIICLFSVAIIPVTVQAREIVSIDINSSTYVNVGREIVRITSGNPQIAVAKQVDPTLKNGFLVEGHGSGTTNILVWTLDGSIENYMIIVLPEDRGLAFAIQRAIGLPNVQVKKIGDKILLTGTVENQYEHNYALQVAGFYVNGDVEVPISTGSNVAMELDVSNSRNSSSGSSSSSSNDDIEGGKTESTGSIVDLLKMLHPTQIRLEAQVIDINSDNTKDLGIQYGYDGSGGIFSFGENHDRTVTTESYTYIDDNGRTQVATYEYGSNVTPFHNNPYKWISQRFGSINATIRALVQSGKARILSRPSITTMSGEQATIQIGGQIPYTTSNLTGTTVRFKDYGIILQCRPVVDADNKITVAINAEASNLSGMSVDSQPIISTRHAEAVVNLESGASMLIGGLMDSSEGKSVQKIPLLGDIPIIGEFFKYSHKTKSRRELIIIITPVIVSDNEPARMSEEMKDLYTQGQDEQSGLESVDLNPPVITENDLNSSSATEKEFFSELPFDETMKERQ